MRRHFEQGGCAQFGGAHPRALPTAADGTIGSAENIRAAIRTSNEHFPVTKCVTLENTHNLRGGKVLPMDYVQAVGDVAKEHDIALHLDGARVWHAAASLGLSLEEVGAPCDSLSVCLSKALGAPAGSVLVGSGDLITKAQRLRKGLGGTMRQTGVLAAAGLVALDEILPNLADDHANAQALADGLGALGFEVEPPQTNLLYFSLTPGESPPSPRPRSSRRAITRACGFWSFRDRTRSSHEDGLPPSSDGRGRREGARGDW